METAGNARKFVVVMLIGAMGMIVSAEQRRGEITLVQPPVSPIKFAGSWRPAGATDTRVVGSIIDIDHAPISHARVQLRELKNGAVVAHSETNDKGEYEFPALEPGTFVVEMVTNYQIVALSNAGTLGRYQTLRTLIQLPGRWNSASNAVMMRVPAISFFGKGAASSATSSTLALASGSAIRPIDGGEPVSPQ